jgi:hypothetical protein
MFMDFFPGYIDLRTAENFPTDGCAVPLSLAAEEKGKEKRIKGSYSPTHRKPMSLPR